MTGKKKDKGNRPPKDALWAKAKRLCRLSQDDVRMAKELGMSPESLMKNIPSPTQRWKLPVKNRVRELHAKRFGGPPPDFPAAAEVRSLRGPEPRFAPKRGPEIDAGSELRDFPNPYEPDDVSSFGEEWLDDPGFDEPEDPLDPPSEEEIAEEDRAMRKRQRDFLRAAEVVAEAFGGFPEVERVVLFGSVAVPLPRELPRFPRFRRHGVEILHECGDVDLAVYVTDLSRLNALRRTRSTALDELLKKSDVGVAHHQVDVFLLDAETERYLGRLCAFGECPRGKRECNVPRCGRTPFLRQVEGFRLDPEALSEGRSKTLLERPS